MSWTEFMPTDALAAAGLDAESSWGEAHAPSALRGVIVHLTARTSALLDMVSSGHIADTRLLEIGVIHRPRV